MKTRLLTCVAAGLLTVAVGCQSQKKIAEPNPLVDNAPAPAPVAYQPAPQPIAQPAAVTATPAADVTPAVMTETPTAPTGSKSASSSAIAGHKYTIKKGDNLYTIAKKRYGSGNDYKKILAANPGLNENRLVPGKTIVLP